MPFLSIIIVTWNNENFIEQAIRSCIDSSVNNYEVLIVHNASDDRTGDLIYRSIEGHKGLFRVIENEQNVGLGEGRNIGIKHAKGEYLMFLDGDDYFEPSVIGKIIHKLKEKRPDVLFYDYQRVWDTGYKAVHQFNHLLHEHDASATDSRKKILNIFNVAWNKAYKKSFIDKEKLTFPVGYYEDITWTYTALLKASVIYTIPLVALNYRQRHGSILKSTDERHLILPDRYEHLLSLFINNHELTILYGETMLGIVRKHVFARPVWPRLPKSTRKQYLNKASKILKKWRNLAGVNKRDYTLMVASMGIPILYGGGKTLVPLARRIYKKGRNKAKKIFLFIYKHVLCRLPINKKKIYLESYWGSKLDCNPLALAKHIKNYKNYKIIVGYKNNSNINNSNYFNAVKIGSLRYWYEVATSRVLITNTNLRTELIKRNNTIHVQTQHGTPIKYMGIDNRDSSVVKMNWKHFAKRSRRWDYVISSNPYSSMIWRRSMPYDYKVIESGYPRNDLFFNDSTYISKTIREKLNMPDGKTVILYAPTFRDGNTDNSINNMLAKLCNHLGSSYTLLVRSHHLTKQQMDVLNEAINSSNVIDVSSYPYTNDLCLISDLLITDYSSIMFDYACLKRPIVLFTYDYDDYVKDRGVYFDIRENAPGAVAENIEDLVHILENKVYETEENQARLIEFNRKFCPWDDGKASERVWKAILGNEYH